MSGYLTVKSNHVIQYILIQLKQNKHDMYTVLHIAFPSNIYIYIILQQKATTSYSNTLQPCTKSNIYSQVKWRNLGHEVITYSHSSKLPTLVLIEKLDNSLPWHI